MQSCSLRGSSAETKVRTLGAGCDCLSLLRLTVLIKAWKALQHPQKALINSSSSCTAKSQSEALHQVSLSTSFIVPNPLYSQSSSYFILEKVAENDYSEWIITEREDDTNNKGGKKRSKGYDELPAL